MDDVYKGYSALYAALEKTGAEFMRSERLSRHTTIGLGGSADLMIFPKTSAELSACAELCRGLGVRFFILGCGSNLLISDSGFRGAAISTRRLGKISLTEEGVLAEAGATLASLAEFYAENSLAGAEFLAGIPATVGGAVVMNAGCHGREIADIAVSVGAFSFGKEMEIPAAECGFGYRKSAFSCGDKIVTSCLFRAKTADSAAVGKEIERYRRMRETQPKGRTMGSTFRNGSMPAGEAIEKAGLKGLRVGGAHISEAHANFIMNDGTASSQDVYDLIRTVKALVRERVGISLEEEIIYIGDFN